METLAMLFACGKDEREEETLGRARRCAGAPLVERFAFMLEGVRGEWKRTACKNTAEGAKEGVCALRW